MPIDVKRIQHMEGRHAVIRQKMYVFDSKEFKKEAPRKQMSAERVTAVLIGPSRILLLHVAFGNHFA